MLDVDLDTVVLVGLLAVSRCTAEDG